MDSQEIANAIIEKMKQEHHIFWVDPESHSAQHNFIQVLIEEREEKKERNRRIKERVAGSLILSAALSLVGLIGVGALDWIKQHIK